MSRNILVDDDAAQIDNITLRLKRLEQSFGAALPSGPFTASSGSIASGAESTVTVTTNLGLANTSLAAVVGHLFDGSWSHQCGWRAVISADSIQIRFLNQGPNNATPNLRFYVVTPP